MFLHSLLSRLLRQWCSRDPFRCIDVKTEKYKFGGACFSCLPGSHAVQTTHLSWGGRWHSLLSCAGKIVNYDFAHDVSAGAIKGFSSGEVAHSVFFQGYVQGGSTKMKRISILIPSPFRYGGCAASEEETRAPAGMKPRGNRPFIRGIFAFFKHCFFGHKTFSISFRR